MKARCATEQDDLTVLWPDAAGHRFQLDQVFVVSDPQNERAVAGALVFHGGHSIAYIGAITLTTDDHRGAYLLALLEAITSWARQHGVTKLAHGASIPQCIETCTRLGAQATKIQTLMEWTLEPIRGDA